MRTNTVALFGAALVALAGMATAAIADTRWEHNCPRQDRVLHRTQNQEG